MALYSIASFDYGVDIGVLAERRLRLNGLNTPSCCVEKTLLSRDVTSDELDSFVSAAAELMYRDLRHFELARLVNLLPVSLRDKQKLLPQALYFSLQRDMFGYVKGELYNYLEDSTLVVAEGFMRFRIPEALDCWAMSVDRAGEELQLRQDYEDLLEILSMLDKTGESEQHAAEVRVILYDNGMATLSNDRGAKIDCSASEEDGMLTILMSMMPTSIIVYDLSGGHNRGIMESINAVFGRKARFYIKKTE